MLFFKKNKPFLSDLIPNDYVDIHSHLLPAIDDGAKNIENTVSLITDLKNIGFNEFITTPHVMDAVWENTKSDIEKNHKHTCEELKKVNITNSFSVAAEYMIDNNFKKLIREEKLLTLKDNYVLVEMSYSNPPMDLYDTLFELQVAGYKPILAHPERYSFYHFSLSDYNKLKHAGCLFQLNLLSSVGYYGASVAKTADYLLKNNLIDFVGSDVHHRNHVEFLKKKTVLKNLNTLKEVVKNNSLFKSA